MYAIVAVETVAEWSGNGNFPDDFLVEHKIGGNRYNETIIKRQRATHPETALFDTRIFAVEILPENLTGKTSGEIAIIGDGISPGWRK